MSELIKALRSVRADMLGTAEEGLFHLCHEAADNLAAKDAEIAGLRKELQSIWDNMPMEWKLHIDPHRAIIADAAIEGERK